jgi:hypothetical protein
LKELVENIEINNPKGKHDRRWKHDIEDVYNLFKTFDTSQREDIRDCFYNKLVVIDFQSFKYR